MDTMNEEILPCPFCGQIPTGPEHGDDDWWIDCIRCEIVMSDWSRKQLIKRWNTRYD